MENCLPFTDDVMVVLVHKYVQQTHLLALHLETLGYILHYSKYKYVLKKVSFGSKDCTKELKLECAYFLCQTS